MCERERLCVCERESAVFICHSPYSHREPLCYFCVLLPLPLTPFYIVRHLGLLRICFRKISLIIAVMLMTLMLLVWKTGKQSEKMDGLTDQNYLPCVETAVRK